MRIEIRSHARRALVVGEQPGRFVVVCLAEPDLAEEVIHVGNGQQLLKAVVPGEVLVAALLHQGLAFVEEFARAGEVAAGRREVA
jgi:hypothetical protein